MLVQITNIISIIFTVLIFMSPNLINKKWPNRFSSSELQSMSTTFGILGTFIGIIIGLWGFDVNNIYGSVPQLLEGLKLAFLTSISGMGTSILLKLNRHPFYNKGKIETSDDVDSDLSFAEAMLDSFKEMNAKLDNINNDNNRHLKNIETALTGEGETTLVTQIQKLRTLISDKSDDLLIEFREFAKTMAENNSKALIEALTQVMKDFNTKINEQFGDNFKQLNQAVERILIWQENYKEQIELMLRQFENSIKIVENSEKALSKIGDEMKELTTVNEKLKDLIILFHNEIETISKIAESAKNAFPIIEENITKLTSEFSQKVLVTINEVESISKLQQESINQQIQNINEISKTMDENIKKTLAELNSQIDSYMKQNADRIANQLTELDKALQEELTKSLQSFASQLASLSSKFAEDYLPITENLKKILESFRLEK